MRIKVIRKLEVYIKGKINQLKINKKEFTIISNNCFGTFIYKQYGLPYQTPFVNLFIFAEDYINLLENFTKDKLENMTFIDRENSKYKEILQNDKEREEYYPIGLLKGNIELHFLHYKTEEEALDKWKRRCEKMNWNRLIFKFSDSDNCKDEYIERFDKLEYKDKVCFTAKEYPKLKSVIYIEKFKNKNKVTDEWKYYQKYYNIAKTINNLN